MQERIVGQLIHRVGLYVYICTVHTVHGGEKLRD